MIQDTEAYKRRKEIFDAIGEMDWQLIDRKYKYHWRQERLEKAKKLGFNFISECSVKLYKKYWSYRKVSEIIGLNKSDAMGYELKKIGIKLQQNGGYRPGDKRSGCNKYQYWDDKLRN